MIHYFFSWYSGGVWSNLLASAIWTVPIYIWGKFNIKKVHKRLDSQDDKAEQMHESIRQIHNKVHEGDRTYG